MASTREDPPRRSSLVAAFVSGGIVLMALAFGRGQPTMAWLGVALMSLGLYLGRRTG
jgi:LPXTG-motif cell wall-anchored protein